jgi:translation initiation factor 6
MTIATTDLLGSDQVGVYLARVGKVLFHPIELEPTSIEILDATLDLERCPISIGGSNLVGALLAGNTKGMAVADIVTDRDVDILTSYGDVVVMEGGVNTAGNLMVVNEHGAVVSPSIPRNGLEILADVLNVDVAATTIAGQDVVGSLSLCNAQGVLLHPDVTAEEVEVIQSVLDVAPMVGTVAFGSPYIGAGACASDTGAVAGQATTGPELNRLEDALGFL